MAERSTRNKMRWQLQAANSLLDKVLHHLSLAEEKTEGRSTVINDTVPNLVLAITELQTAISRLRNEV